MHPRANLHIKTFAFIIMWFTVTLAVPVPQNGAIVPANLKTEVIPKQVLSKDSNSASVIQSGPPDSSKIAPIKNPGVKPGRPQNPVHLTHLLIPVAKLHCLRRSLKNQPKTTQRQRMTKASPGEDSPARTRTRSKVLLRDKQKAMSLQWADLQTNLVLHLPQPNLLKISKLRPRIHQHRKDNLNLTRRKMTRRRRRRSRR